MIYDELLNPFVSEDPAPAEGGESTPEGGEAAPAEGGESTPEGGEAGSAEGGTQ